MAIFAAIAAPIAGQIIGGMMGNGAGGSAGQQNLQQSSALDNAQAGIATDQYNRYKSTFVPLEDQYVSQAQGLGSEANQNKAAQTAAAGVAGQYAGARQRLNQQPGGLSQQQKTQNELALDLGEAGTSAAAQTTARQGVVDRGRAAMTDAVSLGKGMPMNASSMLGSAASGLNTVGQAQYANGTAAGKSFGTAVGGLADPLSKWISSQGASTPNYGISSGAGTPDMSGTTTYNPEGGVQSGQVINNPSAFNGGQST